MAGMNPAMVVKIAADISAMRAALKEGTSVITTTTAAMGKLASSFDGSKIIQHAHNVTAAVNQIGGASRLTAAEQARVNTVVEKAIEKYRVLGQQAPADMQRLADATKKVETHTALADKSTGLFAGTFARLVAAFSVANLIDRVVSSLVSFAKEAFRSAGAIVDLAAKTGLSMDTIQRMSFVAKQTGTDVDAFTKSAFNLGVQLAGGSTSVKDSVGKLGLSFEALKAQKPDLQFVAVIKALEGMIDPQERNRLGVLLFGKTFQDMASAVSDGYTKLANGATVVGDAQVLALERAGDAYDKFLADSQSKVTTWIGNVVLNFQGLAKALKAAWAGQVDLAGNTNIELPKMAAAIQHTTAVTVSYVAQMKAAKAEIAALTVAQRAEIAAGQALGIQTDILEKKYKLTEGTLKVFTTATTAASAAFKQMPVQEVTKKIKDLAAEIAARPGATITALATQFGADAIKMVTDARNMGITVPANLMAVAKAAQQVVLDTAMLDGARKFLKALNDEADHGKAKIQAWAEKWLEAKAGLDLLNKQSFAATRDMLVDTNKHLETGKAKVEAWAQAWIAKHELARVATLHLYGGLTNLFDALARLTGSDFLQWLGDVAAGLTIAKNANVELDKSLTAAGDNITAQAAAYAQWGASAVAALDQATQSASKWKAALGGMMAGAQAGSQFGWQGAVVGAIAGIFVGLIKSEDKLAAARRAAMDSIVKERAAFVELAGGITVLREKADLAGISLDKLFQFQANAAEFKAEIDRINAAFAAWQARIAGLNQAAGGLGSMTAGFAAPFEAAQAKIAELKASLSGLTGKELFAARVAIKQLEKDLVVMAAKGQQQFTNLGTYALATFAGILKQTGSLSQAFDAVGPSIDALIKLQGSLGFTSSATVQALMDIRKVVTANQAVMQSVDGLNQVMAGLTAAGQVNQALFTAFSQDATVLFAKLQAGGATGSQALALMQPTLQQLWQMQQDFGFAVDDGTQALIDQAVAQGIVGAKHKSVSDKMLEALLGIQGAVEALALVLTQGVGGALGDLGTRTRTNTGEWRTWGDNVVLQAIRAQRALDSVEAPDTSVPGPGGGVPSTMSAQSSSSSSAKGGGPTSQSMSSTVGDVHVHFGGSPSSVAQSEEYGFTVADTVIKLIETNTGGRRTKARKALRVA